MMTANRPNIGGYLLTEAAERQAKRLRLGLSDLLRILNAEKQTQVKQGDTWRITTRRHVMVVHPVRSLVLAVAAT